MPVARILARGQVTLPREVRRKAGIKPGDMLNIEVLGPGLLRFSALPVVSPRELRERYPIEVPVDEEADRAGWQETAATDVLGK